MFVIADKKTVIDHPNECVLYDTNLRTIDRDNPSTYFFEHQPGNAMFRSPFLRNGYNACKLTTDLKVVRNRQQLVQTYLEDFNGDNELYPIFNMMHLITRWNDLINRSARNNNSFEIFNEKIMGVLDRFQHETQQLALKMDKMGYSKAASKIKEEWPYKKHKDITVACKQGRFDYLIVEPLRNGFNAKGVMGSDEFVLEKRLISDASLYGKTKWDQSEFPRMALNNFVNSMIEHYSAYGALYCEAFYMYQRQNQGKNVCMPEINENGVFEILDAEPIIKVPNPRTTSLFYDKINSRVVLNGLHSGGKTFLLRNIPQYYVAALRGFPLPAKYSNVPKINDFHLCLESKKHSHGGSLQSELTNRKDLINKIGLNDLVLIDEFLQHASPDAAEELEPVILEEFYKTGATVIVVTHRGDAIKDGDKWHFYSPGFEEINGEVKPTYSFQRGRPPEEIMKKHAAQLLQSVLKNDVKEQKDPSIKISLGIDFGWINEVEKRILEGRY